MVPGRFAAAAHRRLSSVPILARCPRTSRAAPRTLAAQPAGDALQVRMARWQPPRRARVPSATMTRTADCAAAWRLSRPRPVLARTAYRLARHAKRRPRAMAAMALTAPHCLRLVPPTGRGRTRDPRLLSQEPVQAAAQYSSVRERPTK